MIILQRIKLVLLFAAILMFSVTCEQNPLAPVNEFNSTELTGEYNPTNPTGEYDATDTTTDETLTETSDGYTSTESDETVQSAIQPLPINPDKIGLAKGVISHKKRINVKHGGTLGGAQTDYNFTVIPENTLMENLFMYFKLTIVDDPEDPAYGTLIYTLHSDTYDVTDNISFQEGACSYLYLNKEWVDLDGIKIDAQVGIYNVNDPEEQFLAKDVDGFYKDLEKYNVEDLDEDAVNSRVWSFYRVEVPHFSQWAWGILE